MLNMDGMNYDFGHLDPQLLMRAIQPPRAHAPPVPMIPPPMMIPNVIRAHGHVRHLIPAMENLMIGHPLPLPHSPMNTPQIQPPVPHPHVHVHGTRERDVRAGGTRAYPEPLICVSLLGWHFSAMLDTGSSDCILGNSAIEILRSQRVPTTTCALNLRFAGGQRTTVAEKVGVDVEWGEGRETRVNFLLLPTLDCPIILGRNFLHETGMVLNIRQGGWALDSTSFRFHPFDYECPHMRGRIQSGTRVQTRSNANGAIQSLNPGSGSGVSGSGEE